ncbi:hypothetical protein ACN261_15140 [Micromonospora sp. WMMD723]|uniref:hypothetical protein n=1 Tax=Micromonospora sp. WMMD723 TaxID=3403465 RepID=UPI003CF340A0
MTFDDSLVEKLRIDLPGHQPPLPLTYHAGREKLAGRLAEALGQSALKVIEMLIVREAIRRRPMNLPPVGWQIGADPARPGNRAHLAGQAAGFTLGGVAIRSRRDIISFIRHPHEGYYDPDGRLVVHGMITRGDLLSRWDMLG